MQMPDKRGIVLREIQIEEESEDELEEKEEVHEDDEEMCATCWPGWIACNLRSLSTQAK